MKLLMAAVVAARLGVAAGVPGDLALDFLPADAKVAFGIRVSSIVQSPLFKDAGAADAQKMSDDWIKLVAITGFDPLHDIDEVLAFSAADNENASALLVIRGRFNLERMGAGATRYHGVAILGSGKGDRLKNPGVLALFDASTIVAGELPAVHAAIDRRGHGIPLNPQMAARVQALRERFEIWGAGDRPEGFVSPNGRNEQLDSMDRFEFGISLAKGLELGAEVRTRLPQDAEKLAGMVQALKAMTAAQGQAAPKIDVQVTSRTVKVSLAISEEELKKAIATQRAAITRKAEPAFNSGPPVIVGMEPAVATPAAQTSGTTVVVLPGKK